MELWKEAIFQKRFMRLNWINSQLQIWNKEDDSATFVWHKRFRMPFAQNYMTLLYLRISMESRQETKTRKLFNLPKMFSFLCAKECNSRFISKKKKIDTLTALKMFIIWKIGLRFAYPLTLIRHWCCFHCFFHESCMNKKKQKENTKR